MQPDFNPQVIKGLVMRVIALVTSAVVMGITSDKLSLELVGKRYCYYGRTQSNPYGSAAACDLAIASGAVTLSLCVIFSAIAVINALRGADHKLFHMAEYILMIIVELLWIVFLIYQMAAKTALHAAVYGALGDDMVSGIVVIVFCALSIGFTGACAKQRRGGGARCRLNAIAVISSLLELLLLLSSVIVYLSWQNCCCKQIAYLNS